jgi:hypothetical protein
MNTVENRDALAGSLQTCMSRLCTYISVQYVLSPCFWVGWILILERRSKRRRLN